MPTNGPTTGQIALVIVTIAFYIVGGAISLTRISFERPWSRIASKACLHAGVVISVAVLVWHAIARQSWVPLEDNFDTLVWLALSLAVFVMYVQAHKPIGGLDWFVMPIVLLLLIGAVITGTVMPREYKTANLWLSVHLLTVFGGAVAFAIAGAGGAMYLVVNHRLRHKLTLAGPNMGSLERLEHLMMTAVTLGFALLTIGAVTGLIKMHFEHQNPPLAKIILSSAVWLVYALVLHSPFNPSFRGRRAAMLSIFGFGLMVGTVIAVLLLPSPA